MYKEIFVNTSSSTLNLLGMSQRRRKKTRKCERGRIEWQCPKSRAVGLHSLAAVPLLLAGFVVGS